ncbi:hypothetical protein Ddye_008384 [Dipteronia dyeriana]|uniref:Uncharacterized protein n=1 Tax=Dipteronia dyeriana TaxID=168575 RepID=A0AAE0CLA0_9ROSI|nr:hypothetical protein Ddye_008384 [Dipteronia dyeriana]
MLIQWEMKFSSGVICWLLLRELDHDRPTDEMRFLLRNHVVKFFKVVFCLFTGLCFGVVSDMSMYAAVENGIHQRYFPEADEVLLEELMVVLTLGVFQEAYDAMKPCLIYMLDWILMGVDERFKIPVWSSGEGFEEEGEAGRHSEIEASDLSSLGFIAMDTNETELSPRPMGTSVQLVV